MSKTLTQATGYRETIKSRVKMHNLIVEITMFTV